MNVADPFAAAVEPIVSTMLTTTEAAQVLGALSSCTAPGPKSVEPVSSGIISPDNKDPTADAVHTAHTVTGLSRGDCAHWNIVPWVPYGPDGKWTAPKQPDVDCARLALQQLLTL